MMFWINGGNAAACQLALGNVGDHAGVEVYFYLVACVDAVRRCLALEDGQTDIDGVAVEDTRERRRDNAGNAVLAENKRCVLTEEPQPKLRVATTMSPGCIFLTKSASMSSIAWVDSSFGSAIFR